MKRKRKQPTINDEIKGKIEENNQRLKQIERLEEMIKKQQETIKVLRNN